MVTLDELVHEAPVQQDARGVLMTGLRSLLDSGSVNGPLRNRAFADLNFLGRPRVHPRWIGHIRAFWHNRFPEFISLEV